jgi:hypothetical protein
MVDVFTGKNDFLCFNRQKVVIFAAVKNLLKMIKQSKIVDLLKSKDYNREVNVKGWVRTKRESASVAFIALNDGSIIHHIQIHHFRCYPIH